MDKKAALLLLVTGFPRSGTTLLNKILASHPDIEMSFEFNNLNVPTPYEKYIEQLRDNWRERRLVEWEGRPHGKLSILKNAWFYYAYRFLIGRYAKQTIEAEMVLNSLRQLFPNKRYIGDKYPRYRERIPEFSQLSFVRCLVIYRDVRHVVPSFKKKFANAQDARTIAENWANSMRLIAKYQDKLHLIRYEDLLQKPDEIIQAMADYLELEADGFHRDLIRSDNNGDYRQKLSEAELADILEVAGEQMRYWGYL